MGKGCAVPITCDEHRPFRKRMSGCPYFGHYGRWRKIDNAGHASPKYQTDAHPEGFRQAPPSAINHDVHEAPFGYMKLVAPPQPLLTGGARQHMWSARGTRAGSICEPGVQGWRSHFGKKSPGRRRPAL